MRYHQIFLYCINERWFYLCLKLHHFFIYRIQGSAVLPTRSNITNPALRPGYCLEGSCILDERIEVQIAIEESIYHSVKLVVDNNSMHSTKVYLDNTLYGSFQEHFAPRLKGGVFVVNAYESVGLFKNFVLRPCDHFDVDGNCVKGT